MNIIYNSDSVSLAFHFALCRIECKNAMTILKVMIVIRVRPICDEKCLEFRKQKNHLCLELVGLSWSSALLAAKPALSSHYPDKLCWVTPTPLVLMMDNWKCAMGRFQKRPVTESVWAPGPKTLFGIQFTGFTMRWSIKKRVWGKLGPIKMELNILQACTWPPLSLRSTKFVIRKREGKICIVQ